LKLFDGAFAASQIVCDLPNALVLGETHLDNPALIGRKIFNKTEDVCAILDRVCAHFFRIRSVCQVWLLSQTLEPVRNRIGSDSEKPGGERGATPLESPEVG
jgi:hypothetical protein